MKPDRAEPSASAEEGIDSLLRRSAIRELALAYADAVLVRDAEAMMALWVRREERRPESDALDFHRMGDWVRNWDTFGSIVLHVTNHVVFPDGPERAQGRVFCQCQMDFEGEFIDQTIVYQDYYALTEDGWRFDWRRHLLWFGAPRPANPLDQAGARWPRSQVGAGTMPQDLEGLGAASGVSALR